ncbi:hypothetical protein TVAG_150590 [Trichomonas vaginalis G3]|uniref:Glycosyltransferase 61 catalytic domain-containing protein n=1 Tax=Trichomonas vaginalis (strain ATCC PRA-98 / G3) TaxID=412133 RepID=A2DRW1_TRIV3|nr:glycosyltransferase family [Trichomonas vaginalis G3]EAY16908.1 hypothetical protein TVAG_150590 [Trichomonas vaginalis G3]KAI5489105.1 glycosyltransferase family [Trichomonas vaginalis G3]|eukprot:XP_001329131.1 hypothetical protein [Trichomonas vaginalis G3]
MNAWILFVLLAASFFHIFSIRNFVRESPLGLNFTITPLQFLDSLSIEIEDNTLLEPHTRYELKIRERLDSGSAPLYAVSYQKKEKSIEYNINGRSLNVSYIVLYDIYFSSCGGLSLETWTYVNYGEPNSWVYFGRNKLMNGPVSGHYQDLICLGWEQSKANFGHTIFDFLSPLMLIPEDIRKTTPIVMNGIYKFVNEVFDLMEIPNNNRVVIKENTWVHVDRCYTFLKPMVCLSVAGRATIDLSKLLREKFDLDKIEPTRFYYSNREKLKPRYITNMEDLVESIKINFPNIPFTILRDNYRTLRETALKWAKAKLVVAPIGSNCLKLIFMKKETVVIAAQTYEREEIYCPLLPSALSIFFLQYSALDCSQFFNTGGPINISLTIKMIEIGLRCVNDKKWPSDVF